MQIFILFFAVLASHLFLGVHAHIISEPA